MTVLELLHASKKRISENSELTLLGAVIEDPLNLHQVVAFTPVEKEVMQLLELEARTWDKEHDEGRCVSLVARRLAIYDALITRLESGNAK